MSSVFRLLRPGMGRKLYLLGFLALVSGACNLLLLKTVAELVAGPPKPGRVWWLYALFLGVFFVSSRIFGLRLLAVGLQTTAMIRTVLVRAVAAASFPQFQKTGRAEPLASLTKDSETLTEAPETLIILFTNAATSLACFLYLCWLSPAAFAFLVLFILLGVGLFELMILGARVDLKRARLTYDRFLGHVHDLFEGFKELSINAAKKRCLVQDDLDRVIGENLRHQLRGGRRFITANIVSHAFIFIVLGLFLFSIFRFSIADQAVRTTYVLVMLYLIGPIRALQNGYRSLIDINIAAREISDLFESLGLDLHMLRRPLGKQAVESGDVPKFQSIVLRGVGYTYPVEGRPAEGCPAEGFRAGPFDLEIKRGERLFIAGGNGSGKTTLIYLLLGLLPPDRGEILLDGKPVTPETLQTYMSLFSVVFNDFHLFEKLYGLDRPSPDPEADSKIERLRLTGVVRVQQNRFNTLDLSQGQRRRLALLAAWLEDKPILVMDELAADQDPEFRDHFYRVLLPELKREGKTVIAITHDDRYFAAGDRLVTMESGAIRSDQYTHPEQ